MNNKNKGIGVRFTDKRSERFYVDIEPSKEAMKELKELKKKLELDIFEENLSEPFADMYCLCCGRLVLKGYKGELWDSMCFCLGHEKDPEYEHMAHSKCLKRYKDGEWAYMISMSMDRNLNHKNCKECKSEKEHIKKTIEQYLGKKWKDIKPENGVEKIRDLFISDLTQKIKKDETKNDK